MMKRNTTTYCLAFILLVGNMLLAQEFQGKAYYESKTTMDMNGFGSRQMSEEQKKQMAERMKSMLEKTYVLTFNRSESIYKEDDKLETPGAGGGRFGGMMSSFTGGPQYKNIKESQLLQDYEFFGKQFLIKDSLPKMAWAMENESKQIGQYLCFKATTLKEADALDFNNFRRRGRENEDTKGNSKETDSIKAKQDAAAEIPKQIKVTAWYTPQIPVNQGPGDYWGLPGLILEVTSDKTTILCSKIVLNPQEKEQIKAPSKGKEVTKAEFADIAKKKMEEMRDMYQGRGNGGGNRRP